MCEHCKEIQSHPTTTVRGVEIDEKLAPLMNILWSIGIRTTDSCQEIDNHPLPIPIATISFETPDDATKFITLLAAANPQFKDDLCYLDDHPSDKGFRCYIWYQGSVGHAFAQMFPTVTFEMPAGELEEITRNITQHLSWVALTTSEL